jgi:hypothetical protein
LQQIARAAPDAVQQEAVPDAIGQGVPSKRSDGLRSKFLRYSYRNDARGIWRIADKVAAISAGCGNRVVLAHCRNGGAHAVGVLAARSPPGPLLKSSRPFSCWSSWRACGNLGSVLYLPC